MKHVSVELEGIRGAGKSTLAQMLYERSADAVVCEKRKIYPYDRAKARVYTILNNMLATEEWMKLDERVRRGKGAERMGEITAEDAAYQAVLEFPDLRNVFQAALDYSAKFAGEQAKKQALIAYMYTTDRAEASEWVRQQMQNHDVIFDRWRLSGCAYQEAPGYGWRDIKRLHDELGVTVPSVEIVLTLPLEEINSRRYFRLMEGTRSTGAMVGRAEANLAEERRRMAVFLEMAQELDDTGIFVVENMGVGVRGIRKQVEQALPAYRVVERIVRDAGFALKDSSTENWEDPETLERIRAAQM
ncbi:MAG: hypothetical protein HY516_03290 [Candidatus Aenigmarchaeota archaeon]|nr:hypothetical protein [Candidatus Aenigmarchaeota archaeon]